MGDRPDEASTLLVGPLTERHQIETNKARDDLRTEVSSLVVLGASKVINKEIDASKHKDLLDQLAAEL